MEAKFFFAALVLNGLSPISGFNQGKVNSFNLFSPKFEELYRIWYVFIHIKTSDVLEQIWPLVSWLMVLTKAKQNWTIFDHTQKLLLDFFRGEATL